MPLWVNISTIQVFLVSFVTGAAMKFAKNMKGSPFTPSDSPETSQSEEDISPASGPEFLADLLQHQRSPTDMGLNYESGFDTPRRAAPQREPQCASCHSKTATLQRCSGCKRVFYCSTTCQKKHWKEHRPECQKYRL